MRRTEEFNQELNQAVNHLKEVMEGLVEQEMDLVVLARTTKDKGPGIALCSVTPEESLEWLQKIILTSPDNNTNNH